MLFIAFWLSVIVIYLHNKREIGKSALVKEGINEGQAIQQ